MAILLEDNSRNVSRYPLDQARAYVEAELAKAGKPPLAETLPAFDDNYLRLQSNMKHALGIKRIDMPVIEPGNIDDFEKALNAGNLDLFKPYTFKSPYFPDDLFKKPDDDRKAYVMLGQRDGNPGDDKVPAKITQMAAGDLFPIQNEVWLEVITDALVKFGPVKPGSKVTQATIIISKDRYILDGHHRWGQTTLSDPKIKLKVLEVPLDIALLLRVGRSYGGAMGNAPKQ